MELLVHFNFEIQNKLTRVKKFPHVGFAVKFFRNLDIHLFDNFTKFKEPLVLCWGSVEWNKNIASRAWSDSLGIFCVFEN